MNLGQNATGDYKLRLRNITSVWLLRGSGRFTRTGSHSNKLYLELQTSAP
jgi:hypothetical protein